MPKFATQAKARFAGNDKVHIHCFGLGSKNGAFALSDDGPASNFVDLGKSNRHQVCEIRAINPTLDALGIDHIDLLKINIEGSEYDVLPSLITGRRLPRIRHLQIQFHTVGDLSMIGTRSELSSKKRTVNVGAIALSGRVGLLRTDSGNPAGSKALRREANAARSKPMRSRAARVINASKVARGGLIMGAYNVLTAGTASIKTATLRG